MCKHEFFFLISDYLRQYNFSRVIVNLPCTVVLLVSGAICHSSYFSSGSVFVMKMALYCKIYIMFDVQTCSGWPDVYLFLFYVVSLQCTPLSLLIECQHGNVTRVYFEFWCKGPLGQLKQVSPPSHFRLESEQS